VNYDSIRDIYRALYANSISAENLVLGMGGALLQKLDRDTQKFCDEMFLRESERQRCG
jgi:nicotinamide phosphoribosyltransferase